jgi:hypothetical protein
MYVDVNFGGNSIFWPTCVGIPWQWELAIIQGLTIEVLFLILDKNMEGDKLTSTIENKRKIIPN